MHWHSHVWDQLMQSWVQTSTPKILTLPHITPAKHTSISHLSPYRVHAWVLKSDKKNVLNKGWTAVYFLSEMALCPRTAVRASVRAWGHREREGTQCRRGRGFHDACIQLLPLYSMIISPIFPGDVKPKRLIRTKLSNLPWIFPDSRNSNFPSTSPY